MIRMFNASNLRRTQPTDLKAILEIHIEGFSEGQVAAYVYPYRDNYPKDHLAWKTNMHVKLLKDAEAGKTDHIVLETTNENNEREIVGFAVWSRPSQAIDSKTPPTPSLRDSIPERVAEWARVKAISEAKFNALYGAENRFQLDMLSVSKKYQGKGAGRILCMWGLEKAEKEGFRAVTLRGTTTAVAFYERLGMKVVGVVHGQIKGESEYADLIEMVREFDGAQKRTSEELSSAG